MEDPESPRRERTCVRKLARNKPTEVAFTSYNEKGLPLVATLTMFAMLAGFLLVFLLPYSQVFGWAVFLTVEVTICALIVKKLLEARRRISAAKLSKDSKLH